MSTSGGGAPLFLPLTLRGWTLQTVGVDLPYIAEFIQSIKFD